MYLIFAYDNYYPKGGMCDLVDLADDLEAAKRKADDAATKYDHAHVAYDYLVVYETSCNRS